jgi:K+ transporter
MDIANRVILLQTRRFVQGTGPYKVGPQLPPKLSSGALMQERGARHPSSIAALGFASLGVVFGDIGTSPLYTLKTVLDLTGGATPAAVLGVLSLIVWTLIAITSIKYVTIAMRVDNDGEGGILALMALLGVKRQTRPGIVALGLFRAALIYGDGAITPAISVLSALEGLTIAAPGLGPYVVRWRSRSWLCCLPFSRREPRASGMPSGR